MTLRLLTNINSVSMGSPSIRLHCHALLLETPTSLFSRDEKVGDCRIRGFLTDGALEVFDFDLKCEPLEYEAESASSQNHLMMSEDGALRPLFSGHLVTFKDGTTLTIISEDQASGLDVTDYSDYQELWRNLPLKVLEYWQAPYMPVRMHLPKAAVPDYLRTAA